VKLIYVCSPLRGDVEGNRERCRAYCEYVFDAGYYPIAPHLQLDWLDDNDECDRASGMKMGIDVLKECDELWVFGDGISNGMAAEIRAAEARRMPTKRVDTKC
jgi:hypothetical protein